jgi:outer membrane lipoprotein-sorting protein
MTRRWLALAACGTLAVAGLARADVKSDAVFKKARAAAAGAKTLEADVVLNAGGRAMNATLAAAKPNKGILTLRGPDGKAMQTMISTGTDTYMVMDAQKMYQKMPGTAGAQMIGAFPGSPIDAFFQPKNIGATGKSKYIGPTKVGGKTYQVVQVTGAPGPGGQGGQKLFFGAGGLMEGIELAGMPGGGKLTMWLKNMKVNGPLDQKRFAYTPPADYNTQKGPEDSLLPEGKDAPDFRLPQLGGTELALSDARKDKKAVLINFWFYG